MEEISDIVHCRTGSLEKDFISPGRAGMVHCRTGSLEMALIHAIRVLAVHCRTGSLEKRNNDDGH